MAHARIDRIDVSPALEWPGVIAAFSGGDLAEGMGSLPCAWPVTEDIMLPPDHPPIAVDEVRYAGDPVAVVVASDQYAAAAVSVVLALLSGSGVVAEVGGKRAVCRVAGRQPVQAYVRQPAAVHERGHVRAVGLAAAVGG